MAGKRDFVKFGHLNPWYLAKASIDTLFRKSTLENKDMTREAQ